MGISKDRVSIFRRSLDSSTMFVNVNGFFGSSFKNPNAGRAVVLNAITHDLFSQVGMDTKYPLWFRTGFAYYLASYSEPKNNIMLGDVTAYSARLSSMLSRSGRVKKFDASMVFSRKKDIEKTSGTSRGTWLRNTNNFYMSSFLVVHYLYADDSRRRKLVTLLEKLIDGESHESAFESAFLTSYAQFDDEMHQYITARSLNARVWNRDAIKERLNLNSEYQVSQLESIDFFRKFARSINDFDGQTFPQEIKSKLVKDLKIAYPEIFVSQQPAL